MLRRAVALLVLAPALVTCSEDRGGFGNVKPPPSTASTGSAPAPPERPSPRVVVVSTPGFAYQPEVLRVAPGEEVVLELRNRDSRRHTLTVAELSLEMRAEPGETVRLPITVPGGPGSMDMFCTVPGHRAAGHEGVLRIG